MTCFLVLILALVSQKTDTVLVTYKTHVPARYLPSSETQRQQNAKATNCDVKRHLTEFATAVQFAIGSLDKETYLYQDGAKTKLPASIESISILDAEGKVKDSTISEFIGKTYALPSPGETKESEYYIQLKSTRGIRWILIKTKSE